MSKKTFTNAKWQKKQFEILSRDNFKCVLCNDSESELVVNNLVFSPDLINVDNENFETLCKTCYGFKVKSGIDIIDIEKIKLEDKQAYVINSEKSTILMGLMGNKITYITSFGKKSKVLESLYKLNNK